MDKNEEARVLLTLGLSVKQVSKLRNESLHERLPLDPKTNLTKRVLEKNVDLFVEPYDWIVSDRWGHDEIDWEFSCGSPSFNFPYFHAESEMLRNLKHDENNANLTIFKLPWFLKGIICIPNYSIAVGEELTRNWLNNISNIGPKKKSSLLIGMKVKFANPTELAYHQEVVRNIQKSEPLQGTQVVFSVNAETTSGSPSNMPKREQPYTIFSDDPVLERYLAEVKDTAENALIYWEKNPERAQYWYTLKHIKFGAAITGLPKTVRGVNQFPFEASLVRKDISLVQVSRACQVHFSEAKDWSLDAFDLETELAHFLCNFHKSKIWIIKPAQEARGSHIVLTDSIPVAISAMNLAGGDKIAQAYVQNPMLLNKTQKFDCRTLVVVQSFRPALEAWICIDGTYARVARKAFDIKNLCLKQSHLTVSKYEKEDRMDRIDESVIPEILSRQELCNYFDDVGQTWKNIIEPRAWLMIKQLLQCAGHWIGPDRLPSCGACYGVDWLVDNLGYPKLIEINFCPDLGTPATICRNLEKTLLLALTKEVNEQIFDTGWKKL